jgi:glycosyltransferase involved in cell wall biosynthesis
VYDLDDAEYIRHPDKTLKFFLTRCAYITVGSIVLKEYALKFNSNVILNTSPVIDHDFRKGFKNEKLTIGWVGDMGNGNPASYPFSHKKSLFDLVFPSLKNITIPIKLILIGVNCNTDIEEIRAYFSESKNLELVIPEGIDWQNENWLYSKIKEFDIGISPLVDHEFNRAKSAFKVKQYLSCGVPVLGSKIGENQGFIDHGDNGFLCDSQEEFRDKILEFSSMSYESYIKFSKAAYETSERFTMKKYCNTIFTL